MSVFEVGFNNVKKTTFLSATMLLNNTKMAGITDANCHRKLYKVYISLQYERKHVVDTISIPTSLKLHTTECEPLFAIEPVAKQSTC